ncbi:MAG: peptidoglycan DD-metalloendopeptidase family protein [Gammaproteobacteria bacterium]|jgi:septal ring factor EnvC (AmiA/AmiB activator)|nr:peptidoglycan DD-metalloendopeptidase family protein [Gammaproteobacteria bacterium]
MKSSILSAFFLLSCILYPPALALADENLDSQAYQKKLSRLQQSIVNIQAHLKETQTHRGHTLTELQQLERNISANALTLKNTETKINTLSTHIAQLRKELDLLARRLEKQRFILAEQLRSAYSMGARQSMKMLLNQQDPAEIGRIQAYYSYLNRARESEIQSFIQSIQTQQQQKEELSRSLASQKTARTARKNQHRALQKQRLQRNQLLAQLDKKINNQEQTLLGLESSRNKIEELLRNLGQLLADIPAAPGSSKPFNKQKGKLPWPVGGPFLAQYGQSRHQGDLKWKGVLISAPYGTPVRAISHGRIAFSDWLQGYGFIIIVDHSQGYMSLYGHNETLLKQTGDWVAAGETLATTGDSGGQPKPGLYFEIRERGKPINPTGWCTHKVPQHVSR